MTTFSSISALISLITILIPIICIIMITSYIVKSYKNSTRLIEQNDEIIALLKENRHNYK